MLFIIFQILLFTLAYIVLLILHLTEKIQFDYLKNFDFDSFINYNLESMIKIGFIIIIIDILLLIIALHQQDKYISNKEDIFYDVLGYQLFKNIFSLFIFPLIGFYIVKMFSMDDIAIVILTVGEIASIIIYLAGIFRYLLSFKSRIILHFLLIMINEVKSFIFFGLIIPIYFGLILGVLLCVHGCEILVEKGLNIVLATIIGCCIGIIIIYALILLNVNGIAPKQSSPSTDENNMDLTEKDVFSWEDGDLVFGDDGKEYTVSGFGSFINDGTNLRKIHTLNGEPYFEDGLNKIWLRTKQ